MTLNPLSALGLAVLACGVTYGSEVRLDNGPEGAVFAVAGEAPKLPNGTVLHVTLALPGNYDPPNQISFFQVRVQSERFTARKTWEKRSFAPLAYEVRVDLLMSEQPPALRRKLSRDLGYRFDDRKLLSLDEVLVGTEEERRKFDRSALEGLKRFLVRVQELGAEVGKAVKASSAKDPAWAKAHSSLQAKLRACQKDLRAHLGPYLAWRDRDVIQGLQSGLNDVSRALSAHARGQRGAARDLIRVAHRLELVQGDVEGRLARKSKPKQEE